MVGTRCWIHTVLSSHGTVHNGLWKWIYAPLDHLPRAQRLCLCAVHPGNIDVVGPRVLLDCQRSPIGSQCLALLGSKPLLGYTKSRWVTCAWSAQADRARATAPQCQLIVQSVGVVKLVYNIHMLACSRLVHAKKKIVQEEDSACAMRSLVGVGRMGMLALCVAAWHVRACHKSQVTRHRYARDNTRCVECDPRIVTIHNQDERRPQVTSKMKADRLA
jgi:hypothetical protein